MTGERLSSGVVRSEGLRSRGGGEPVAVERGLRLGPGGENRERSRRRTDVN